MAKNIRLFLVVLIAIFAFSINGSNAQVQIGTTTYTTLKAAFDAINAGTHTGAISITLNGNTSESAAAVLNASGNGSANYTSVVIYPTTTVSITGAVANGLIELRGADNVTIDGRINRSGSTNSLTIQNNLTTASTYYCAVWLDSLTTGVGGGATNNIIRNCNIMAYANNNSYAMGIVIGSSASLTTGAYGNNDNQILYNQITRAYYGIRAYSVAGAPLWQTTNLQIKYNNISTQADPIGYYGIYVQYCRNAQITDNVISYQTYAGCYGMYIYYSFGLTLSNNTIQNTTSTSTTYAFACGYDTNATINGNNISNLTGTSTSTTYLYYLYYLNNSNIYNNKAINTTTAGTVYGMYYYYSINSNLYNNTIDGINCSYTSGSVYGLYSYYTDNTNVYGNTIQNLITPYYCYGLYHSSSSTTATYTFNRNLIANLRSSGTSGWGVNGIYLASSYNVLVSNNVIYNITSTNYSASSTTYNPFGININGGTGHKILHNTVNLYGSQSGTNTAGTLSAAFIVTGTSVSTLDVRNNVFANSLSGLTGSNSYAVYLSSTTNLTSSTFNYNDYYGSGTYGRLGYLTSQRLDIAAWRTATSQDLNSFASDPSFNASNNLRPQLGSPLVNAGTAIASVGLDYLSYTRSLTTPTVGAYEQAGDYNGPVFTYTALTNTTSTSNRAVSGIIITDGSGVNANSGTSPRLYYKTSNNTNAYNGNTNATDGWKYVETTSSASPFSFTIDYSKIYGSVIPGTIIEYFFVAQDMAATPNVSGTNTGFNANPTTVNLASTQFPVTGAANYSISAILSGEYTVGTGGTFASLTNAGGVFQVVNGGQLSGNTSFKIISDLTSETGTYALNAFSETGGSGYTLSIVPDGTTNRTISGSNTAALVKINGASRVNIDGRFNNSGNYLTITNTNTGGSGVHIASTGTTGFSNVTVRNCTINAGSTTSTGAYGIFVGSTTIGSAGDNCDYVSIMNNNINRAYYGIYVYGTTNTSDYLTVSGNTIGSYTSGYLIGYRPIHLQYVNNSTITKNIIQNITQSLGWDAVYITTGVSNTVFTKNTFKDLISNGTNRLSAFYLAAGTAANLTFSNNEMFNMISNSTGSIGTYGCAGFFIASGSGYNIYHNSVVFTGDRDVVSTTKPSTPSACVYIASGLSSINIRNNLFYNTQTAATSAPKSYAIYNAGAATNFGTINNNDYYTAGSQGMLGYQTSDVSTLSGWMAATAQDANSIASDPSLNSTTVIVPLPNSPMLNAGAAGTGVTDDYKDYTRSVTTPTMGAYEQGADVSGPNLTLNLLANTSYTTNRVATNLATIADYSGINVTTNPPRLYFRKSTDNNTFAGNTSAFNGWKYVTGTGSGNNYTFTIDYSLLQGGAVFANDIIEYFVIAQDNTPQNNTTYKGGTLNAVPTTVALTSANFPMTGANSYQIVPAISGTYYVGAGQTYTSLSRVDGVFSALNKGALRGNVTISVTSDLLLEDGTTALNELPSEGGTFTISIIPSTPVLKTISGSSTSALIKLNGTDNITIDGSVLGSGSYLKFTNTYTTGTIAAMQIASNATGARNVTVKNCSLSTGFNTSSSMGLYVGESPISTSGTGADCDNLTIQNVVISKAYYGIYISGTTTGMLDNLLVENNTIGGDVSTDYVLNRGIYFANAENPIIRGNKIYNMITTLSINNCGIEAGGTINNGSISRNRIFTIKNNNTSGYGAYGINILSGSGLTMDNNQIYDITTTDYSTTSLVWNPFGIRINGGSNLKVYHNSINLYGSQLTNSTAGTFSAALFINTSSITGLDIRNNIFKNSLSGQAGSKSYTVFVYSTTPGTVFSQSNYNDYYPSGTYGVFAGYGTGTNTDVTNLAGWQGITAMDGNSINTQPYFISDSDLHLTGSSVGNNTFYAAAITGVNRDFDNETRKTNPYIGADEIIPLLGFTADLNFAPNNPVYCDNNSNVIMGVTPTILGYGDGIARTLTPVFANKWYKNGTEIIGNSSNFNVVYPIMTTDAGNYWVTINFGRESLTSITKNLYVEKAMTFISQPTNADVCSSDPTLILSASADGTITSYQWQKEDPGNPGTFQDIVGQTNATLSVVLNDAKQATGIYRVLTIGPGNCGPATITSNTASVNVTDPLTNLKTTGDVDLANICTYTTFHLNAISAGTVLGYQWQKFNNGGWVNLQVSDYPTANNQILQVRNANTGHSGRYRCLITGSPRCHTAPVITPEVNVTVWPLFEISGQPHGKLLCKGDSVALIVYAEGLIYSYQWRRDGVPLNPSEYLGASGPMLILSGMQYVKSGAYTCVLNVQDCNGRRDIESDPALVYVVSETKITSAGQVEPSNLGETAAFEVRAHVVGAPTAYQPDVQWYRGNMMLRDNDRIAGVKASILTIRDLKPADYGNDYKVVVTGICGVDSSMNISLVAPPSVNIKTQPVGADQCEGTNVQFLVVAEAIPATSVLKYHWRLNGITIDEDGHFIGTKTSALSIINIRKSDAGIYTCDVTGEPGNVFVASNQAELKIKSYPVITRQSVAKTTVKAGASLDLFVEVTGQQPLTYQWYQNDSQIAGANEATYKKDNADQSVEGVYYCKITNECGETVSRNMTVIFTQRTYLGVNELNCEEWGILQNNPNPFNGRTSFSYSVPVRSNVKIVVTDLFGKEVAVLVNKTLDKGIYPLEFNASEFGISAGTYNYTIEGDGFNATRKMILIK